VRLRSLVLGVLAGVVVLVGIVGGVAAGVHYYNNHYGDWRVGLVAVALGGGIVLGATGFAFFIWRHSSPRRTSPEELSRRLDQAQRVFEGGEVMRAARILAIERLDASQPHDLAAIDDLADEMRAHLSGDELDQFNAAVASQQSLPLGTPAERLGDRGPALWITIALIALMAIGAFGPWAKALGVTVSGTDGSNDGWVVIVLAVLAGLFVWGYAYNGSTGLCVLTALAGIGAFATALHDRRRVTHASALIQVGWGLNLDLVASAVLVVMALVLASRSKRVPAPAAAAAVDSPMPATNPLGKASVTPTAVPQDEASRLQKLAELRDRGLISTEEYDAKRAEILSGI
jgi:hypothetical protein